jgi:RNA polymerase sigma-70 factor, ECF subfamily
LDQAQTHHLAERFQSGDLAAVEAFVQAHHQSVYRLALSILDDAAEADEAAQDSLLAAVRALGTYRGDCAFSTWLYTITANICRSRLRKRGTQTRLLNTLQSIFRLHAPAEPLPEDTTIGNETGSALWQAIAALDEKLRLPVVLRYYHDLTISEIARVLGTSERTIYNRLNTAHAQLKGTLAERGEGRCAL